MEKKRIAGFCGLFLLVAGFLFVAPFGAQHNVGPSWAEAAPTATTKIMYYSLHDSDDYSIHTAYTADLQDRSVEAGENVNGIEITYLLDKAFAATATDAMLNTRFYVTLKNPADSTIIEEYVYRGAPGYIYHQASDAGDSWACALIVEFQDTDCPVTLTTGEWDVIVRYDIFS